MRYVSGFLRVFIALSIIQGSVYASGKQTKCYRLDEKGRENLDQSPLVLCLASDDLEKYPKSLVTVTLSKVELEAKEEPKGRQIASVPNESQVVKTKLLAKRYYAKLSGNKFGYKGEAPGGVTFDPKNEKVYIGFASDHVQSYFYKPMESSAPDGQK